LNCAPQFQSSVYKCLSDVLRSFQPKSFSDTSSEASSLAASNKVIKTEASSLAASKFQVQRSEASSLAASDSKIKRSQATSYKASVPSSKSSSLGTQSYKGQSSVSSGISRRHLKVDSVSCNDSSLCHAFAAFLDEMYTSCVTDRDDRSSYAVRSSSSTATVTFDSGADVHVWSSVDAQKFFTGKRGTSLRIIGVSNKPSAASFEGGLDVRFQDKDGNEFDMNLGTSYAVDDLPLNLLSISKLLEVGAVLHFEKGKCYFKANLKAPRIPLVLNNGLFQLPVDQCVGTTHENSRKVVGASCSYALQERCYGAAADLQTWHRRVRHINPDVLSRIYKHQLVDGFKLRGNSHVECGCDACRQAIYMYTPFEGTVKLLMVLSWTTIIINVNMVKREQSPSHRTIVYKFL